MNVMLAPPDYVSGRVGVIILILRTVSELYYNITNITKVQDEEPQSLSHQTPT